MKRFTETTKWTDPWFRRLSERAKLLWFYLTDNCNSIGLIELDFDCASFHIGGKVEEKHLAELGDRVQRLEGGKLFIPKFIPFQYGELSLACPAHKPVLKLVNLHQLTPSEIGYQYPNARVAVGYPYPTGKERKGMEPEKEPEKEKERAEVISSACANSINGHVVIKEFSEKLKTGRMMNKWGVWMNQRRKLKKPGDWVTLFNAQVEFLEQYDEPTAFEILSISIRNGWQGLFELKPQGVRSESAGKAPVNLIIHNDELKRIEAKLKKIREGYDSNAGYSDEAKLELRVLKSRQSELRQLLGVQQ